MPELGFLSERVPRDLGSGPKWALEPDELECVFPGSIGTSAPLRHIVVLDPVRNGGIPSLAPLSAGVAAVELARATPPAAGSLIPVLARLGDLVAGCRYARLRAGDLSSSLDCLLDWLDARED